jgi:hypothetical protein
MIGTLWRSNCRGGRPTSHGGQVPLSRHPGWLLVLAEGLGHSPYCLALREGRRVTGILPLIDDRIGA